MVGHLPLEQSIGVRIPGGQPERDFLVLPKPSSHGPRSIKTISCEIKLIKQSRDVRGEPSKLRSVVLSSSVPERLARLLLEWCKSGQETETGSILLTLSMTHEEIGEFIGTTRETVTRTLGEFKHRKLLTLQGSTLTISSLIALQQFAGA